MAYTPINWQTGDTITADKLNRCDNGWGVESTLLFSETVTTADDGSGIYTGNLAYSSPIDAESIVVTFDGIDYTCGNMSPFPSVSDYGAPWSDNLNSFDFSEYPFNLVSNDSGNVLTTETAGTHTVSSSGSTIVTSADFNSAAQLAVAPTIAAIPTPYSVTVGTTTLKEVFDALAAGEIPVIAYNDGLANSPRYIEIILYARVYNRTAYSITIDDGTVTVKNYTAQNANSPIVEAS